MKKKYNQPETMVSHLNPMSILCASTPAIRGGGTYSPIGGGDPGTGI